jgi:lysophospholipase L1-like esterase
MFAKLYIDVLFSLCEFPLPLGQDVHAYAPLQNEEKRLKTPGRNLVIYLKLSPVNLRRLWEENYTFLSSMLMMWGEERLEQVDVRRQDSPAILNQGTGTGKQMHSVITGSNLWLENHVNHSPDELLTRTLNGDTMSASLDMCIDSFQSIRLDANDGYNDMVREHEFPSFSCNEEIPNYTNVDIRTPTGVAISDRTPTGIGIPDWYSQDTGVKSDMKRDIQQILSCIQNFTKVNDYLQNKLDRVQRQLDAKTQECTDKVKEIAEKSNEITKLREEVAKLSTEMSLRCWDRKNGKKSLLIGDSLIRDVDSNRLDNTDIAVLSGGTVTDALNHLNDVEESLNCIYLCVGTNDCSPKDADIEKIRDSYTNLVVAAKKKTDSIVISSIPPRLDNETCRQKVESLNAALVSICSETGATFVDHTDSFMLRQGEINDGYLHKDGVHLTAPGTQRLIKNLKVPLKDDKAYVCKASRMPQKNTFNGRKMATQNPPVDHKGTRSQTEVPHQVKTQEKTVEKFRGARNTFSNFYPSNIYVWNMNFQRMNTLISTKKPWKWAIMRQQNK